MNWGSLGEFLAMGGYGLYVWGSFGMCALVFGAECWGVALRRKALRTMPLDDLDDRNQGPIHEA